MKWNQVLGTLRLVDFHLVLDRSGKTHPVEVDWDRPDDLVDRLLVWRVVHSSTGFDRVKPLPEQPRDLLAVQPERKFPPGIRATQTGSASRRPAVSPKTRGFVVRSGAGEATIGPASFKLSQDRQANAHPEPSTSTRLGWPPHRPGTWPIEGVLEQRGTRWYLHLDGCARPVRVDHPTPGRLVSKTRRWLITYGGSKEPTVMPDRRNATEREADAARLAAGSSLTRPVPVRRFVRVVRGGAPGLGRRG